MRVSGFKMNKNSLRVLKNSKIATKTSIYLDSLSLIGRTRLVHRMITFGFITPKNIILSDVSGSYESGFLALGTASVV